MSNPTNETFGQARQGSVAAIIQVLNEQLSTSGIRTRAIVADGMLQLLCEAAEPQQLDRQMVVSRVRQILENISPQRISKVNINSRIVKEEQLLWLEEINRDPENALLWSEVITLKRPFFVNRWLRDRHLKPAGPIIKDISEPEDNKSSLSSKLIGSVGLAALLLGTLWLFRDELNQAETTTASDVVTENTAPLSDLPPLPSDAADEQAGNRAANTTPPSPPTSTGGIPPTTASAPATDTAPNTGGQNSALPAPAADADPDASAANGAAPTSPGQTADAFAEAVRIANLASTDGLRATTTAEWLDLAARWQRASDLMAQIPSSSEQYDQAAERVKTYADNSQAALAQAAAASESP
ncbi:MAG: hypothetical protein AAFV85_20095 [Cyanobacteria bacterium J06634_6]